MTTGKISLKSFLLGVALLSAALNLRTSVASIGPVLNNVITDNHLPSWFSSAITSIPILCFGLFAFCTYPLSKHLKQTTILATCLCVLTISLGLRFFEPPATFLIGTFLAAVSVAIINILMPSLIKTNFPNSTLLMSNLYSSFLFISGAAASGATVPIESLVGGSWRSALGFWSLPCLFASVFVILMISYRLLSNPKVDDQIDSRTPRFSNLLRHPTAFSLMLFMGLQSAGYYAIIAWLPSRLQNAGISRSDSGIYMILLSFASIVGSISASPLISKRIPNAMPSMLSGILIAIGYFGVLVFPTSNILIWLTTLGLGQGLALALAIFYISDKCSTVAMVPTISLFSQGFGYILASLSPALVGVLLSIDSSWTLPFIALFLFLLAQIVSGLVTSHGSKIRHS